MTRHIAAFHVGVQNETRVTGVYSLSQEALDALARSVARKCPGHYYVAEVSGKMQRRNARLGPLYTWHVGDGFEHADGWWVEA